MTRGDSTGTPGTGGSLVFVGTGIQLGRHVSARSLSEIDSADVVFGLADAVTLKWLTDRRPDLIPLSDFYAEGKNRRQTYREMTDRILDEVRAGKRVCAVFYGHPGVFADVPHDSVERARREGHEARIEPGISAEACLYADLGIDPGKSGVQSFEATQFLVYRRRIDPAALLILWQVALCGDLECTRFEASPPHLSLLVDKLSRDYPMETEVILYEASQMAIGEFRADRLPLADLPRARFREYTTLVIPPVQSMDVDRESLARLRSIEAMPGRGPGQGGSPGRPSRAVCDIARSLRDFRGIFRGRWIPPRFRY